MGDLRLRYMDDSHWNLAILCMFEIPVLYILGKTSLKRRPPWVNHVSTAATGIIMIDVTSILSQTDVIENSGQ